MIYQQMFNKVTTPKIVQAVLVGAGDFGTAIVTQSKYIDRLKFTAVADINIEAAYSVYRKMGYKDQEICFCKTEQEAQKAYLDDIPIVVEDAGILMTLPINVVITATRVPEVGAKYAYEAIRHGKHVVFVDKEADTVIAPILKKLADDANVVFTTDDGDEPGLLMGLVGWARTLGMEVVCGGNIDHCLYDEVNHRVIKGSEGSGLVIEIQPEDRWALEPIPAGQGKKYMDARNRIFGIITPDKETGDPVSHMAVAVNGTGLIPDIEGVHRPVVRFTEMPEVLCLEEYGGVLKKTGVIEQPIILHTKDEPHGGGGIFVMVTHDDEYSRNIMAYKGLHHNESKTSMLIFRPYHLCGAETAMSALCAGLLGVPTGMENISPVVDIIAKANRKFVKGEIIGVEKGTLDFGFSKDFQAYMVPGAPTGKGKPIPYFMLYGNTVAKDIAKGEVITYDMICRPKNSVLWDLREKQDAIFFK